ncbi:MAG: excinuclease ABC subunit A, partial [Deltaproteobacteria bacterium]
MKAIRLYKVRQNNLKGFDLEIPLGSLTVITGVSGAGKSSLAFDTLYAEGQRRYVETFSPYARQFMERMDRPRVERIEGIPPAIAIEQGDPVKTSRSTVGTMTEITDYVKLLFPRLAQLYCRRCGRPVRKESPERAFEELSKLREGTPLVVTFPLPLEEKVEERRRELLQRGFYRVWMGGLIPVEEAPATEEWDVVVDRFLLRKGDRKRILDSLEMASREGRGRFDLQLPGGETLRFSEGLDCPYCGIRYREPTPNLFSFNSPVGACETCKGFGRVMDIDLDLVIPDQQKSLQEGAIRPWTGVAR